MKSIHITLLTGLVLMACSDAEFSSSSLAEKKNPKKGSDQVGASSDPIEIDAPAISDSSVAEEFKFGGNAKAQAVDFLFVIDNSSSMTQIKAKFVKGMDSLIASEGVFPKNSKIAVMTTVPADPEDLTELHPRVGVRDVSSIDPGFLRLVNKDSIASFKANAPKSHRKHFPLDGCVQKWFSPKDKNSDGQSCLTAASQIALVGLGAEAGLTAFHQLVQKNGPQKTFRTGAAANVLFVSDTHDPGMNNQELKQLRPTFEEIEQEVKKANKLSSFKAHAIAPDTSCGEGPRDRSYFQAVEASKGRWIDACVSENYSDLIKGMIEVGSVAEKAIFVLKEKVGTITSVTVDDKPYTDYVINNRTIEINHLSTKDEHKIIVKYLPQKEENSSAVEEVDLDKAEDL